MINFKGKPKISFASSKNYCFSRNPIPNLPSVSVLQSLKLLFPLSWGLSPELRSLHNKNQLCPGDGRDPLN